VSLGLAVFGEFFLFVAADFRFVHTLRRIVFGTTMAVGVPDGAQNGFERAGQRRTRFYLSGSYAVLFVAGDGRFSVDTRTSAKVS
jgi:hypothetical protein